MNTNYTYKLILGFLLIFNIGFAQDSGDQIFDSSILHEINFEFTESNYWQTMTDNYEGTIEGGSVPYLMGKVTIDGVVVDSVGVRFKGFTSYDPDSNKKPIKIDFNEFVSGKKYDGMKKLNLNNGTGDPSMMRDIVCYDLMRNSGVKASRTSFSKVYFNGEYWGLYQNIEQIDKTFVKNNFGEGTGNLFKNKGWAFFDWLGEDHNSYHPPYELKTNKEGNDWSGLINLMDVLNNTSDTEFPDAIQEIFNVDLFLKTLVVDVATNNWDSNLEHGRNWYMYEDTTTGVFNWIPWDYNFALNGGNFNNYYGCFIEAEFKSKLNGTPTVTFFDLSYSESPLEYSWDFGDGNTSIEKHPVYTYATSGSYNVCLTTYSSDTCSVTLCEMINTDTVDPTCSVITDGTCEHEENATFFTVIKYIPSCCSDWNEDCEEFYGWLAYDIGLGSDDFAINQQDNERLLINKLLAVPEFNTMYYNHFCNLMSNQMTEDYLFGFIDENKELIADAIELDPNLLYSNEAFLTDIGANDDTEGIKGVLSGRILNLQIELADTYTCPNVTGTPWHDIVINEFIAATDSTTVIVDQDGDNDDWIELFNNTDQDISLDGMYLSDESDDIQKWQFPEGTSITANGYLIVWADKDEEQLGLHANFKLKKNGEQIYLSNTDGTAIDTLSFGEQTVNVASARIPNGTGDFVFQATTFSHDNENVVSVGGLQNDFGLTYSPNPASDYLEVNIGNINIEDYKVEMFSVTGQLVLTKFENASSFKLNLNNINNGFYLLKLTDNEGRISVNKIVVKK